MKKIVKLLFPISLLFCLVLTAPKAFAEETDFSGKSWDEIIEAYLAECNASEGQVAIGYYNTVTGEEHFYDPDRYMIAGSMYKVPLTMVFAEKLAAGEISLEDTAGGYRYDVLLKGAIVNSSNDYAAILWRKLGSYHEYRRIIAPTMGEDPDNVDEKYYENNFFTARQMLTCLKNLYDGQETYAPVIDLMKQAEPREYFRRHEDRYEVAHKYGYLADDKQGIIYLNDCGIIYTDDPYLLVCFTAGVEKPYGLISNLCTLMSDYTEAQREARIAAEEEQRRIEEEQRRLEAEEKRKKAMERETIPSEPSREAVEEPAPEAVTVEPERQKAPVSRAVVLIVLSVFCAGLTVCAQIKRGKFDLKGLIFGILCILVCVFSCIGAIRSFF